jgi:hypothetical protein
MFWPVWNVGYVVRVWHKEDDMAVTMQNSFEPAVPATVLQSWLAMAGQATDMNELRAAREAVQAVLWEWSAASASGFASYWLSSGRPNAAFNALDAWQMTCRDLRRASRAWGEAASFLTAESLAHKGPIFGLLYQEVLAHQQRLNQQVDALRVQVVQVCQAWGIALADVPDLSEGGADGSV